MKHDQSQQKFIQKYKYLILIVLGGLLVRLIGIRHGFPFIFHPDEPALVRSATGIRFDPNPGHFDWPHLHFYLNYGLHFVFTKFRGLLQMLQLRSTLEPIFPYLWRDPLVFYLLSRVFNAVLGAATAIPVYLTAQTLFKNKKIAILAALILAITPFHIHTSKFALIDIPMVFWLSWGIYFAARILYSPKLKNYIFAGIFIGFAASTKYHGGLSAFIVLLAHIFRITGFDVIDHISKDEKIYGGNSYAESVVKKTSNSADNSSVSASSVETARVTTPVSKENLFNIKSFLQLCASGIACIAAFVLGTPYSVFDFNTFISDDSPNGALWQFTNVGSVDFLTRIRQFFTEVTTPNELLNDFGYTFLILFLMLSIFFIAYALTCRQDIKKYKNVWLLLIPGLFLFFYISGFQKTRSHFYLVTYPYVVILVAYFVQRILTFLKEKEVLRFIFAVLVFSIPLYLVATEAYIFARPDTRVELYNWLRTNTTDKTYLVYNANNLFPVIEKFSKNDVNKFDIHEIEPFDAQEALFIQAFDQSNYEIGPTSEALLSPIIIGDNYAQATIVQFFIPQNQKDLIFTFIN